MDVVEENLSRLQATEMRWRGIENVTRIQRIRITDHKDEVKVESPKGAIERKRLPRFGHVLDIEEMRMPRRAPDRNERKKYVKAQTRCRVQAQNDMGGHGSRLEIDGRVGVMKSMDEFSEEGM